MHQKQSSTKIAQQCFLSLQAKYRLYASTKVDLHTSLLNDTVSSRHWKDSSREETKVDIQMQSVHAYTLSLYRLYT
jgi:hypothetical protein